MSRPYTAPLGAPCWVDLQSSNAERAREFYTALFGWTALESSPDFGGYFMFTLDGKPVAGAMPSDAQAPVTDVWSVYLASDDIDRTLATAASGGAHIVVPPTPIADLGSMGFLIDAGGAGIGVWQPGSFPGFAEVGTPGAPGWFELQTRAYLQSVDFYRTVFGWQVQPDGMAVAGAYAAQTDPEGGERLAGILDAGASLPEQVPAQWTIYFTVPDVGEALGRVEQLGGKVLQAKASPWGSLATVADPNGAVFKLCGPRA